MRRVRSSFASVSIVSRASEVQMGTGAPPRGISMECKTIAERRETRFRTPASALSGIHALLGHDCHFQRVHRNLFAATEGVRPRRPRRYLSFLSFFRLRLFAPERERENRRRCACKCRRGGFFAFGDRITSGAINLLNRRCQRCSRLAKHQNGRREVQLFRVVSRPIDKRTNMRAINRNVADTYTSI